MSVREPLALVGARRRMCGIAELLAAAREQCSGVLVVSGEPGIGKSALCAWAAERAAGLPML